MATIAKVNVNLTANTAKFSSAMKKAKKDVRSFGATVKHNAFVVAKWTAGIGAAGAAVGGYFVRQQMQAIDVLAKTSAKLGIGTEALAGFQHAAGLAGVNVRTFNMALQRVTRRMAEAAEGGGEAKQAIKDLGLNAKELTRKGPEAAMLAIADAMQRVGIQGKRVMRAFKLFDSEGVALVNLAQQGSKAIKAMMEEAKLLGLTLTDIQASRVEKANDAFLRMKGYLTGIARQITARIAPFLAVMVNRIVEFTKQGGGAGAIVTKAFSFMTRAAGYFLDVLQDIQIWFKKLEIGATNLAITIVEKLAKAVSSLGSLPGFGGVPSIGGGGMGGTPSIGMGGGGALPKAPGWVKGLARIGRAINPLHTASGLGIKGRMLFDGKTPDAAVTKNIGIMAKALDWLNDSLKASKTELKALEGAGPWSDKFKGWLADLVAEADAMSASVKNMQVNLGKSTAAAILGGAGAGGNPAIVRGSQAAYRLRRQEQIGRAGRNETTALLKAQLAIQEATLRAIEKLIGFPLTPELATVEV